MGKYFDGETGQILDQDVIEDKETINRLLPQGRLVLLGEGGEKAVKGDPTFPEDRRTRVAQNLDNKGVEELEERQVKEKAREESAAAKKRSEAAKKAAATKKKNEKKKPAKKATKKAAKK